MIGYVNVSFRIYVSMSTKTCFVRVFAPTTHNHQHQHQSADLINICHATIPAQLKSKTITTTSPLHLGRRCLLVLISDRAVSEWLTRGSMERKPLPKKHNNKINTYYTIIKATQINKCTPRAVRNSSYLNSLL